MEGQWFQHRLHLADVLRRVVSGLGVGLLCFVLAALAQILAPDEPLAGKESVLKTQLSSELVGTRTGSGLVLGILGGFRTLAADITWLRMNEAWEDKNLPETEALIRLTVLIDPRPEVFWRSGAHTLAFDIPVWRIREAGGESEVPESIQKRIRMEQMVRGVRFLQDGALLHPDNPMFPIEIGKIYLNAAKDFENTIQYFYKAWEMPNAPHYIGRLLARVLETAGRPAEALSVLKEDWQSLPHDDPEAYIDLVQARIIELETLLAEQD